MTDRDDPEGPDFDVDAARRYVLDDHRETVVGVLDCADEVASTWDATSADRDVTDHSATDSDVSDDATDRGAVSRAAVVEPLARRLESTGLLATFPDLLAGAVAAAGCSLRATPVPAPPYVAVTSRGPVLRATTDAGRLVVLVRAFDVERGEGTRYVRGPETPDDALELRLR